MFVVCSVGQHGGKGPPGNSENASLSKQNRVNKKPFLWSAQIDWPFVTFPKLHCNASYCSAVTSC